jgi:hypothetical protein
MTHLAWKQPSRARGDREEDEQTDGEEDGAGGGGEEDGAGGGREEEQ